MNMTWITVLLALWVEQQPIPVPRADLIVEPVAIGNCGLTSSFRIKNIGNLKAPATTAGVKVGSVAIKSVNVPPLGAGDTSVVYSVTGAEIADAAGPNWEGVVVVAADSTNVVVEKDERNIRPIASCSR